MLHEEQMTENFIWESGYYKWETEIKCQISESHFLWDLRGLYCIACDWKLIHLFRTVGARYCVKARIIEFRNSCVTLVLGPRPFSTQKECSVIPIAYSILFTAPVSLAMPDSHTGGVCQTMHQYHYHQSATPVQESISKNNRPHTRRFVADKCRRPFPGGDCIDMEFLGEVEEISFPFTGTEDDDVVPFTKEVDLTTKPLRWVCLEVLCVPEVLCDS